MTGEVCVKDQWHSWIHDWLDLDVRSDFPNAITSTNVVYGIHEHDATRSSRSILLYGSIHVWSTASEFLYQSYKQDNGLTRWFSCSIICTLARCHILPIFQHNKEHYNPSLRQINYERNWHAETRMSWLQYLVCAKTGSFFYQSKYWPILWPARELGLPQEVDVYHSLYPLEVRTQPGHKSMFFNHPTTAYKAVSTVDGRTYVLYRVEGMILCHFIEWDIDMDHDRLSIGQWTSNGFCWTLAKDKTLEYCIDSRSIYYTFVWWSL